MDWRSLFFFDSVIILKEILVFCWFVDYCRVVFLYLCHALVSYRLFDQAFEFFVQGKFWHSQILLTPHLCYSIYPRIYLTYLLSLQ